MISKAQLEPMVAVVARCVGQCNSTRSCNHALVHCFMHMLTCTACTMKCHWLPKHASHVPTCSRLSRAVQNGAANHRKHQTPTPLPDHLTVEAQANQRLQNLGHRNTGRPHALHRLMQPLRHMHCTVSCIMYYHERLLAARGRVRADEEQS